ncbi:hypothetical protein DEIPH_ctg081orf0006 [Deinococcus phoenicis]|uniref:Uncharacterized protein n=1 Tax=Deinococcus phoenicis TaxID=1476583 RepID=A0A016QLI2_9DEIO|nr:hypothetical protein [Deinococcus phoenicis]EYB66619.1 hypothetical protein DEIPH_ctg081orf0006 [Deinococcus phoenicis]
MNRLFRALLQAGAALALMAFGAWLTSPKSENIQVMCGHTPFCPVPLVSLQNAER